MKASKTTVSNFHLRLQCKVACTQVYTISKNIVTETIIIYCTYLCRGSSPPLFSCSAIDNNNRLGYCVIATTASHFNISSTNVHIAVPKCGRTNISSPRTKISMQKFLPNVISTNVLQLYPLLVI